MDYFSKWPAVYPIPNQEATTIANVLFQNWVCPREIHSDQGRNFEFSVFQEICKLLGIHKTRTTPLHPESDGMVERFNKTIDNYLRIVANNKQDNWDTQLAPFLLAYRSAIHPILVNLRQKSYLAENCDFPLIYSLEDRKIYKLAKIMDSS
ncbi:uncharacterized protein LOC125504284 [Dendroctonus ponderosae]|uniref:uncharacterized protein LOC125504284 n=1 Tax=Dendroctonus ponderosae TaxID=77166 RepID=UPI002035015E|nr:uncharacterized protein LOC125504284 [Dendroctonus ponderosae]